MAIDLAIGSPISMMDKLCPQGHIELCFSHLLMGGQSIYKKYYLDASEKGRFIILDNGIMELGYSMGIDDLLTVSRELRPDLVTPPEVLNDRRATLQMTYEFIDAFERSGLYPETKLLGVAHGATFTDWCASFQELLQLPHVGRIGIPYDLPFDVYTSTERASRLEKLVTRRQEICEWIAQMHPLSAVHLFGLAHPSEIPTQKKHPFVKSIDTSLPVMSAIHGIRYEESEFGPYEKNVLDIMSPYCESCVDSARHNISVMRMHWL